MCPTKSRRDLQSLLRLWVSTRHHEALLRCRVADQHSQCAENIRVVFLQMQFNLHDGGDGFEFVAGLAEQVNVHR